MKAEPVWVATYMLESHAASLVLGLAARTQTPRHTTSYHDLLLDDAYLPVGAFASQYRKLQPKPAAAARCT